MKLSRTFATSFAILALGVSGVSMACDHDKTQTSAAAASAKSAKGDKACTAEMAAACKAHQGTSATTASMRSSCAAHKSASAVTASAGGSCAAHKSASAVTASAGGKSAKASGACNHDDATTTSAMAKSGMCNGKGMTTTAGVSAHHDCEACTDMELCAEELEAASAHTQIVPLKNGVMFVYTGDSPGQVRAVQAAMVRRGARISQFVAAGDKAHLCGECKAIRGAMASGKLAREVVNIEGGSLTLMTSDDPKMVAKIHSMVDVRMAARAKS